MSDYSFNRKKDKLWRLDCYAGSIVFITWVCVTAVLFPQHGDYVSLSPIALSVCLKAKLKNRCHWTVGECSSHAFLLRLYIPTLSTNGRPELTARPCVGPKPLLHFLPAAHTHAYIKRSKDTHMWMLTYSPRTQMNKCENILTDISIHTHTNIQYVCTVHVYANTQNRLTAAP